VFFANTSEIEDMTAKSDTFSVRLPPDIREQVDAIARTSRRSRSFVVNEAVAAYVRDHAAYLRDIDDAMASARAGVGHSGEQMFRWMRSWGATDELSSPEPDISPAKRGA
jgi:RHH-type transcriptional regulator, rel operon repressor / antitoxin RelB